MSDLRSNASNKDMILNIFLLRFVAHAERKKTQKMNVCASSVKVSITLDSQ